MKPTVTIIRKSDSKKVLDRIKSIGKQAVYVGIPASSSLDRKRQLAETAKKILDQSKLNKSGKPSKIRAKKISRISKSILSSVNNAQLMYIHSKGSPVNHIPARPVIEPAIMASPNKESIAFQLSKATQASLDGKPGEVLSRLAKAGMAGANASKAWFTDSRNNWPPNKPATIKAKGSNRPLIDTGVLRGSITYVVKGDT
jgi:hypothetical protein